MSSPATMLGCRVACALILVGAATAFAEGLAPGPRSASEESVSMSEPQVLVFDVPQSDTDVTVLPRGSDTAALMLDGHPVVAARNVFGPDPMGQNPLTLQHVAAGLHVLKAPFALRVGVMNGDGVVRWAGSTRAATAGGNCTPQNAGSTCVSGTCNEETNTCALPNGEPCANDGLCVSRVCAADGRCGAPDLQGCSSDSVCRSNSCEQGVCQVIGARFQGNGLFTSCMAAAPGTAGAADTRVLTVLLALGGVALIRRRRHARVAALWMLATMTMPGRADATEQGFALERVTLAPANSRWFAADSLVSGPASLNPNFGAGANSLALRLDGGWAHQPLVLENQGITLANVVEDQVALTFHASWNPVVPLRLAVDFPLQIFAQGGVAAGDDVLVLPPPDDAAPGDLAAAATWVFDTPAADALRFGLSLRFRFPTGTQDDYMGDGTTSGALAAGMTGDVGYLAYALTVGGRLRTKQAFAGGTLGSEVTVLPAIGLQTLDRAFLVGLEVPMAFDIVQTSETTASAPRSQSAFSADPLLGIHWWPMPRFGMRAAAGTSLTTALGEVRWRVLAGLVWQPLLDTAPPPPPPPSPPPPPPPPPPDTDGDTIADPEDHCPRGEPGDPNLLGCFAVDTDNDGIFDPNDKCPQEAGTAEYEGCPPPTRVMVQEDRITVNEKIDFEVNKDTLKSESLPTLDDIVKVMQTHSQIKVLQVQGHTDTSGNAKKNRKLSEARAASVKKYLVDHGVSEERLQAKGFGSDQPLVPNDTPAHRSTNRRVDFIIVSGDGSPGGAAVPTPTDAMPAGTTPAGATPAGAAPADTASDGATSGGAAPVPADAPHGADPASSSAPATPEKAAPAAPEGAAPTAP